MKPLTIEQLKELEVCDWVWIVSPYHKQDGMYLQKYSKDDEFFKATSTEVIIDRRYSDYGKTWLAYKNKEEAEDVYDKLQAECDDKERYTIELYNRAREVERELKEIKTRIAKGEIIELPCINTVNRYLIQVVYRDKTFGIVTQLFKRSEEDKAERRLAELKGE